MNQGHLEKRVDRHSFSAENVMAQPLFTLYVNLGKKRLWVREYCQDRYFGLNFNPCIYIKNIKLTQISFYQGTVKQFPVSILRSNSTLLFNVSIKFTMLKPILKAHPKKARAIVSLCFHEISLADFNHREFHLFCIAWFKFDTFLHL